MQKRKLAVIIFLLLAFTGNNAVYGWSEHPMLVGTALKRHPAWLTLQAVEARTLESFILKNEKALEAFLAEHEKWSQANLPNYLPLPATLRFEATGDESNVKLRFLRAIRVNPHARMPLYLHLMPLESDTGLQLISPSEVTTLLDVGVMSQTRYVSVVAGEQVSPFQVMNSATDEPDYGFDLGLFEDNETEYGKVYGFGKQAFGNPKLEYSSQAPFHMGFYHEEGVLYLFGPFLKQTFVDYRVNLYHALSVFAFGQGESYWGWRFAGWAMHYAGDLTMPYHCKPLPGTSTLKMIWMNIKAIFGWKQDVKDAIQLVSNKHSVFEQFQWEELRHAIVNRNFKHPFLLALENPYPTVKYDNRFIYDEASAKAVSKAVDCNDALMRFVPARFVDDPTVEVADLPDFTRISTVILDEKGQKSVDGLSEVIAERMRSFSMTMNSFLEEILEQNSPNLQKKIQ